MHEKRTFRLGPYRLGRCHEEVGPGLGRLYEARHAVTGTTTLLLLPGDHVQWQPQGAWQVRLTYHPQRPEVRLDVEQAPASVQVSELTNLFVLTTAALDRVEDNPHIQAHLARASGCALTRWARIVGGGSRSWLAGAIAGLCVFALGLGGWLRFASRLEGQDVVSSGNVSEDMSQATSAHLVNSNSPSEPAIAYPLPAKPWVGQAVEPCYPELDEVALNGGCWMELGRRAPCLKATQAEYKGKCYAPVTKERTAPRRSAQP
jgi:hypothetical protein